MERSFLKAMKSTGREATSVGRSAVDKTPSKFFLVANVPTPQWIPFYKRAFLNPRTHSLHLVQKVLLPPIGEKMLFLLHLL